MQFPFITHGMVLYYKRQYTDKTLTLRKCMCMRASEASELRKFRYFYILKLLFLSIFWSVHQMLCRYKWHACRLTCNDKFINVPTNFQMYRQKSEKTLLGGGGNCPPAPPLATLMIRDLAEITPFQFINAIVQELSCKSVKGGAHHLIPCMFDFIFIINTCMIYWKQNRFISYAFIISPWLVLLLLLLWLLYSWNSM